MKRGDHLFSWIGCVFTANQPHISRGTPLLNQPCRYSDDDIFSLARLSVPEQRSATGSNHRLATLPALSYCQRVAAYDDASTEEWLAMTFIHGPEWVTFSDEHPAKLRFFLGCVDDLAPDEDGVNQVSSLQA